MIMTQKQNPQVPATETSPEANYKHNSENEQLNAENEQLNAENEQLLQQMEAMKKEVQQYEQKIRKLESDLNSAKFEADEQKNLLVRFSKQFSASPESVSTFELTDRVTKEGITSGRLLINKTEVGTVRVPENFDLEKAIFDICNKLKSDRKFKRDYVETGNVIIDELHKWAIK